MRIQSSLKKILEIAACCSGASPNLKILPDFETFFKHEIPDGVGNDVSYWDLRLAVMTQFSALVFFNSTCVNQKMPAFAGMSAHSMMATGTSGKAMAKGCRGLILVGVVVAKTP